MTLLLTQLEDELRTHLGVDVNDPQWSTSDLDLLLNRTYWEILAEFKFKQEDVTATFSTVASTAYYDLPSAFDYLRHLSIVDANGQHTQLLKMTEAEYENTYDESTAAEAFPTHYVRDGCGIKLWPTPDSVYTVVIKYAATLADLDTTNTNPGIPREWHELIVYGAAYRGFLKLGDYPRYQQMLGIYSSMKQTFKTTDEKEIEDTRFAGVEAMRPDYVL